MQYNFVQHLFKAPSLAESLYINMQFNTLLATGFLAFSNAVTANEESHLVSSKQKYRFVRDHQNLFA